MGQIKEEFIRIIQPQTAMQALIAPVLAALLFGWLFGNNQILNTPVVVVDLDNSMYSRQLIDKLDASPYILVDRVLNEPVEPGAILVKDPALAVIVLPAGLEGNRLRGFASNIGFVINDSVAASVGSLRQGVAEVFAMENNSFVMGRLQSMGLNPYQASGVTGSLTLQQRSLYNPTSNAVNTTVVGFVNLIILALFVRQTARIVPTLRAEGRLSASIRSPLALMSRLLPHILLFFTSMLFVLGSLKYFGGMRFSGDVLVLTVPLLLYLLASGLFGMLLSWSAKTPDKTTPAMMAVVAPSFFFSNIVIPVLLMPKFIQLLAMAYPLYWYTKCYQAIALRNAPLDLLHYEMGILLLLASIFALLILLRMATEKGQEEAVGVSA